MDVDVRAQWFVCVCVCVSVLTSCNHNGRCACTQCANKKKAREKRHAECTLCGHSVQVWCVCAHVQRKKKKKNFSSCLK